MLTLASVMLSGNHMSTVSFLLIWIKVSQVSSIRLGHVASFQPLKSTTIQYAMLRPFKLVQHHSIPFSYLISSNESKPLIQSSSINGAPHHLYKFLRINAGIFVKYWSIIDVRSADNRGRPVIEVLCY